MVIKRQIFFSVIVGLFLISCVSAVFSTSTYNLNEGDNSNAHFLVHTLKYGPFPVSPGNWFDVWVKVQNVGQEDAKNATFRFIPSYPFSSNDKVVRSFGLVSGTISAYAERQPGENQSNSNQVLLKFHVFVNNNAIEGVYNLKLESSVKGDSVTKFMYDLPISVEKSEVDFDTTLQDSRNIGTSFTITNTGTKSASSIIVKINESEWNLFGDKSFNVGKLNNGETTRFVVQGVPSSSNIKLNISYTDISGVRRALINDIPVSRKGHVLIKSPEDPSYKKWLFGLAGIFIGIGILGISRKIHNKKRT